MKLELVLAKEFTMLFAHVPRIGHRILGIPLHHTWDVVLAFYDSAIMTRLGFGVPVILLGTVPNARDDTPLIVHEKIL